MKKQAVSRDVFREKESVTNLVTVTELVTFKRFLLLRKAVFLQPEQLYCRQQDKDGHKRNEENVFIVFNVCLLVQ